MKHASTCELFDYWNERRGERIAPERGDIEPGAIRRVLGDTFILAGDIHGVQSFRLAGTRACALFCRELKGEAFVDLWAKAEQDSVRDLVASVADDSAGIVTGVTGSTADGKTIDLELLLLPLVHRDRSHARLLGVVAPLAAPYWLGTTPVEALACGTIRHLGPAMATVAAPDIAPLARRLRHGLVVHDGGRS
jgi:hypothetical protein